MTTASLPLPSTAVPAGPPPAAPRLVGLRWGVRGAFTLGMAASVAANILHAQPHIISQVIAAWPSLALMCTVEIMSRVPARHRGLASLRVSVTAVIAVIAAYVSYFHMAAVAAHYGETGVTAYLLPFSVDGLVVVASISLVDISAQHRRAEPTAVTTEPVSPPTGTQQSNVANQQRDPHTRAAVEHTALGPRSAARDDANPEAAPARGDEQRKEPTSSVGISPAGPEQVDTGGASMGDAGATAFKDTGEAVAYWRRTHPAMRPGEIAQRIGRSERTVRRHLSDVAPPR